MLRSLLQWPLWLAGKIIFWMRYRVTVTGMKESLAKPGPYLILPNHPAFSDPPNLCIQLWPGFQFRPLALDTNFQSLLLKPIAWLSDAQQIPDLDVVSAEARERMRAAMDGIANNLRSGKNVLIWPSGRLMRDGREHIGGARAVADLLAAVPETTVVLVRTRGLWGSMFSWALTATAPKLVPTLFRAAGMLLSNMLVFAPRRRITMTLEAFCTDERPPPKRMELNPWMEKWFNADLSGEPEKPTFVPYQFLFGRREFDFPPAAGLVELDFSTVKSETKQAVAELLSEKLKRPLTPAENKPGTTYNQLGIDSLDGMELALLVEQRFGFSGNDVPSSIGALWALAEGMSEHAPAKPAPKEWFRPQGGPSAVAVLGETFGEALIERCFLDSKNVAVADDAAGVLTYERVFVAASAMAARFRKYPEPNIGLLMPASVAGDLALIGLHFAGKLPVMLNWTTGPANLAHAVKLMGVTRVITAKAFIDRTQIEVPGAEFVFLEDIRRTMGQFELLKILLGMRWLPGRTKRIALANIVHDPHRPAVVLFTSGSEKAPKAVPLTHNNIISNMRAALPRLMVTKHDSVLGFLPLFHSFGHTVSGIYPIFGGLKIVHHPDPTDSGSLVRKIASYRPTLTAGTPSFIRFLLDRAKPGELDSLKIVALGAEKCPDAVFDQGKIIAPNAKLTEGYGITECSPIVSINPVNSPKRGTVGLPLDGVECRIADLETNASLGRNQLGMLQVSGPSIFPGYIGFDGPSPFEEHDGKRWYVTGDLVSLDDDGFIVFQGRLKRFIKAGGEMISLPALEEPFSRQYPPTDDGPRVAVEGIETPTGRRIVLFTTEDLELPVANQLLMSEGFRGVFRLDEVRRIEKIPTLGTGKTDYKILRARVDPNSQG